ncbi:lactonase family protein [Ferruginibacter yonginensis]|uniref:Lactonase family protein n=1 Tax=Ferruginibacter yonginensis TaxID=1310416 RepID=A0ABV8QPQ9_9BACT
MKLICFLLLISYTATAQKNFLIIGTYTSGKSEGIYVYEFDSKTADFKKVSSIASPNPSYLSISNDQKKVYAVYEEGNNNNVGGSVAAYQFNKTNGTLQLLSKQLTGSDHPCYVAVDKTGKWVTAGNYTGGSISVMPVDANGMLGKATVTQHFGSSVNAQRQDKPHVHCTYFSKDGKYLLVPDLGIDKVMIYRFNKKNGTLTPAPQPFATAIPGAGPRHIIIAPNNKFAYLMQELSGVVTAYKYNDGRLTNIQNISAAPQGFTGYMGSADIHISPDGKFLYCSNRGESNSITIFKIDATTGRLQFVNNSSCLGEAPRNFNFDPSGNFLLVANQKSDAINIFKVDKQTGLIINTGKLIEVGNPVCLKWITQ